MLIFAGVVGVLMMIFGCCGIAYLFQRWDAHIEAKHFEIESEAGMAATYKVDLNQIDSSKQGVLLLGFNECIDAADFKEFQKLFRKELDKRGCGHIGYVVVNGGVPSLHHVSDKQLAELFLMRKDKADEYIALEVEKRLVQEMKMMEKSAAEIIDNITP